MTWLRVAATVVLCLPATALAYVGYDGEGSHRYGYSDTLHQDDGDSPQPELFRPLTSSATEVATIRGFGPLEPLPIGFGFHFFGQVYHELYVLAGGLVVFDRDLILGNLPELASDEEAPNGFIAAAWSTCESCATDVRRGVRGAPGHRQFVLQWTHRVRGRDQEIVGQIVLHEEFSDILVHVRDEAWAERVLVGLKSPSGKETLIAYDGVPSEQPIPEYSAIFSQYLDHPMLVLPQEDLSVPEGGEVEVRVTPRARKDQALTVSWDLDGDGEFADQEGPVARVSAVGLNGPDVLTVHVAAEDEAGHRSEASIELAVRNGPPRFVESPATSLLPGRPWSFVPVVVDPGGDDVTIEVMERPPGMVAMADGSLCWTPRPQDHGTYSLVLRATDSDDDPAIEGDGDCTMDVTLTVENNGPPTQPVIVSPLTRSTVETPRPTFVVETPTDPDGDSLRLVFEVDIRPSFDSDEMITSGPVPIAIGRTGWTCPVDLEDGQTYWWRVAAHDDHFEGPAAKGSFLVELPQGHESGLDGEPKIGPNDGPVVGAEGCSFQAGRGGEALPLVTMVLALVLCILRRRR